MDAPIDLDANATTTLDPRVVDAMAQVWSFSGNAESRHYAGRQARRALEGAREAIATTLHARTDEVIFTSGGTEANNLAIFGLLGEPRKWETGDRPHLVASPLEHPAVSEPLEQLVGQGYRLDLAPVRGNGRVDPVRFAELLTDRTALATLMLANNETGAIQPVGKLAQSCRERQVPFHTDAVQAVGRIPVDFRAVGATTLALSGHKLRGPEGVGALLVDSRARLSPLLYGGGQQRGRRPGTPAVALAVGLAEALKLWHQEHDQRVATWRSLRDRLETRLLEALGPESLIRNGPTEEAERLPQTLNVSLPGCDGDALLMQLDLAGVAISLGSACASGSTQPSPTLVAMGVPADRLRSSIRLSLHATTTTDQVDQAAERIIAVARRLLG